MGVRKFSAYFIIRSLFCLLCCLHNYLKCLHTIGFASIAQVARECMYPAINFVRVMDLLLLVLNPLRTTKMLGSGSKITISKTCSTETVLYFVIANCNGRKKEKELTKRAKPSFVRQLIAWRQDTNMNLQLHVYQ